MTTPQPNGPIEDSELVMRRVRKEELTTDHPPDGPVRPSSDAFLQDGPDGDTSVYLTSDTTAARIVQGYPDTFVAEVEVRVIRAENLDVVRRPIQGDPGHCEIVGRKRGNSLRRIARACRWVEAHAPPS